MSVSCVVAIVYILLFKNTANSQVDLEKSGHFHLRLVWWRRVIFLRYHFLNLFINERHVVGSSALLAQLIGWLLIFHRVKSTILFWSNSLLNIIALSYYNGHKRYTYDYINAVAYYFKIMYKIFLCICFICCVSPHLTVSDQVCHKMFSAMCILKNLN